VRGFGRPSDQQRSTPRSPIQRVIIDTVYLYYPIYAGIARRITPALLRPANLDSFSTTNAFKVKDGGGRACA